MPLFTDVPSLRAPALEQIFRWKEQRRLTTNLTIHYRRSLAFAGSIDALADFGLTQRKAPVTTPEQRIAAVAKAKATRAARHTMGHRQKAAIKGTVPQTAPEPVPATPTAPPTATLSA